MTIRQSNKNLLINIDGDVNDEGYSSRINQSFCLIKLAVHADEYIKAIKNSLALEKKPTSRKTYYRYISNVTYANPIKSFSVERNSEMHWIHEWCLQKLFRVNQSLRLAGESEVLSQNQTIQIMKFFDEITEQYDIKVEL